MEPAISEPVPSVPGVSVKRTEEITRKAGRNVSHEAQERKVNVMSRLLNNVDNVNNIVSRKDLPIFFTSVNN